MSNARYRNFYHTVKELLLFLSCTHKICITITRYFNINANDIGFRYSGYITLSCILPNTTAFKRVCLQFV